MSTAPTARVTEILRRIEDNVSQAETVKTCYGILAIMSRDEANKILIASEGMDQIISAMNSNLDRADVQEAGCDLIWSLAFNNNRVKDIVGKHGGTAILVRALKRHSKSADFLKSACGALSNLCQSKTNQQSFATHGGIIPLVLAINIHQSNQKLLPFIFDALASLVVANEENVKMMSSQDGIVLILSTLSKLKSCADVVKSGCHALAILSDVKGQATKIGMSGGVGIIMSLLDEHPAYADLHRVAAVVILRMLQETPTVAREITSNEGIRILLKSLDKGGAVEDTVAAVTHILSSITSPLNTNAVLIEGQLWLPSSPEPSGDADGRGGGRGRRVSVLRADLLPVANDWSVNSSRGPQQGVSSTAPQVTALGGLIKALIQYTPRRDVVRAGCRLLSHLIGFSGVVMALDRLNILDVIFECVDTHNETRDVLESSAALLKAVHRRTNPTFLGTRPGSVRGLFHVLKSKLNDDDVVLGCLEVLLNHHMKCFPDTNALTSVQLDGWERDALGYCARVIETLLGSDNVVIDPASGLLKNLSAHKKPAASASNRSSKLIHSLLSLVERLCSNGRSSQFSFPWNSYTELNVALYRLLSQMAEALTPKYSDLIRKIEGILPQLSVRVEREKPPVRGASPCLIPSLNVRAVTPPHPQGSSSSSGARDMGSPSASAAVGSLAKGGESVSKASSQLSSGAATSSGLSLPASSSTIELPQLQRPIGNRGYPASNGSATLNESASQGMQKSQPLSSMPRRRDYNSLLDSWPTYLEQIIMDDVDVQPKSNLETIERMHVVYECASAGGYGVPSRVPVSYPYFVPPGGVGSKFDHSIKFDSEFESGNLQCAIQRGDKVYDLCLRPDLHTPGHTQWFYFSVSNIHPPSVIERAKCGLPVNPFIQIQFNIINFTKSDSSFSGGMKPVVYSMLDASSKGIGWVRQGSYIEYGPNQYQRLNDAGEGTDCYYTLTFTIEFHNINDTFLIAYSYPYTYSDHKLHITSLLNLRSSSDVIRHYRLCQTIGGNDCGLIVITNFLDVDGVGPLGSSCTPIPNMLPSFDVFMEQIRSAVQNSKTGRPRMTHRPYRKAIFISSRVHPGETPASWIMKGLLDFLVDNSEAARILRQNFVFFIVPMLNPDGVMYGNNRCSLAGVDLNRQWKLPSKSQHPTVFHLKTLIQEQKMFRDIFMYIDIHGHSRKYNVFLYGCDDKKKPYPKARDFPRLLSQHEIGRRYVCFEDCSFHVKKCRESTARVVVCREFNIPYSYTVEATFCGPDIGPLKYYHMNIGHLLDCGACLCDSILHFAHSEGTLPDGTILPEQFRGMTRISLNSFVNHHQLYKDETKEAAYQALLAAESVLAGGTGSAPDIRSPGGLLNRSPGTRGSPGLTKSPISARSPGAGLTGPPPQEGEPGAVVEADMLDDERVPEGIIRRRSSLEEPSDSSSSDEDEEDEDDDGIEEEDTDAGGACGSDRETRRPSSEPTAGDPVFRVGSNDFDAVSAENDVARCIGGDDSGTEVSLVASDQENPTDLQASSSQKKGLKTRANLRTLIDDESYNVAGAIAAQRVSDGIATLSSRTMIASVTPKQL
jgi:hypothetical protein